MADDSKKDFNAETLLNEHGKDISGLSDRVSKCYSTEKYEEFQNAVQKIGLETIDSGQGRTKIKTHAKEAAKEYLEDSNWKKLTFWLPTAISLVAAAAAIYAVLHK